MGNEFKTQGDNDADPIPSVHPETMNPTQAWQRISQGQKVETVRPMPLDTPIYEDKVRFVCMSDTHNQPIDVATLPPGDVFLHAGDFTGKGKLPEILQFDDFLGTLPYRHKIIIAGNHELTFENSKHNAFGGMQNAPDLAAYLNDHGLQHPRELVTNATVFLEDNETTVCGLRIYGSPWQPWFGGWAYNLVRGQEILDKWDLIPGDGAIDVLMTHGPPIGFGDLCVNGTRAGCVELLSAIQRRVKPKYHISGHIHEDYGIRTDGFTTYINASTCTYKYQANNPAIIFDLPLPPGASKLTPATVPPPMKLTEESIETYSDATTENTVMENTTMENTAMENTAKENTTMENTATEKNTKEITDTENTTTENTATEETTKEITDTENTTIENTATENTTPENTATENTATNEERSGANLESSKICDERTGANGEGDTLIEEVYHGVENTLITPESQIEASNSLIENSSDMQELQTKLSDTGIRHSPPPMEVTAVDEKEVSENSIAEIQPSENSKAETQPSENSIAEIQPSENLVVETQPSENLVLETRPSENSVDENEPSKDSTNQNEPSKDSTNQNKFSEDVDVSFSSEDEEEDSDGEDSDVEVGQSKFFAMPKVCLSAVVSDDAEEKVSWSESSEENLCSSESSEEKVCSSESSEENVSSSKSSEENVSQSTLSEENVSQSTLSEENVSSSKSSEENVSQSTLLEENVSQSTLSEENVSQSTLWEENVSQSTLSEENVSQSTLSEENVSQSALLEENVSQSTLLEENVSQSTLSEENISQSKLEENVSQSKPPTRRKVTFSATVVNIDEDDDGDDDEEDLIHSLDRAEESVYEEALKSQVVVHRFTRTPDKAWEMIRVKQTVTRIQLLDINTPVYPDKVRFVCMSDTINTVKDGSDLPPGDVFLHAGNFTHRGVINQIQQFNDFLGTLPYKHRIVIAGNHEVSFEHISPPLTRWLARRYNMNHPKELLTNATVYLEDTETTVYGHRVYGSPWQPEFCSLGFNLQRGEPLLEKWDQIPEGIDILITHGPPIGHGDCAVMWKPHHVGCVELLATIQNRVKPKYHLFGHIREDYGVTSDGYTTYINASTCKRKYKAVNPPVIFDLPLPEGMQK